METINIIIAVISGGGLVGFIAWMRFKKKDSAETKKVSAEADIILVGGFEKLIVRYQEENRLLQETVNDLRGQVIKLTEQVNKMQRGGAR